MVLEVQQKFRGFTVEDNVYKGPVVDFASTYKTIGEMIWDKLNSHGNKVAHLDARTEETVTYAELQVKTVKCALWLKQQDIGRGDVVTVCTDNHFNSIVPCLSATYVNAIFNTWNENMDLPTALYCLKLIKPKVIFCTAKPLDVIRKALKETNSSVKVVVFDDCADVFSFTDILSGYSNEEVANFRYVMSGDTKDTVCILHSSGTTGMPKGVEHTNYSMLDVSLGNFKDVTDTTSLWFSSLYWVSGVMMNLRAIVEGRKVLLYPVFDEEMTCKLIDKYQVNMLSLSTSMISRFLKAGYIKNYSLSSLKCIPCGGAILKPSVQEDLRKLLPHVAILQAYGMTETFCLTAQKPGNKSGSSGVVANNVQLKIVDPDTGKVLGSNESGEIWVKTRNMMKGYYNNSAATKDTIDKDGWLHTGDIGYVDEDGELFVWDRIKEMLKYRGYQISPGEIEAVLSMHPAVCEVAVVGVPHEIDNDRPLAFVTKKPGAKVQFATAVTAQELIDFVANNMMDQYKLRGGLIFLESFPYTGSGKIARKELKEMAKELAAK